MDTFEYDEQDPIMYFTTKNDCVLSYYKYERKTNYKKGSVDTLGSIFENHINFCNWYRIFIQDITFLSS